MAVGHLQAVAPIPAQKPVYGLLVAADVTENDTIAPAGIEQTRAERWQQGITWAPEQIGAAGAAQADCLGGTPDGLDPADNEAAETAEPFVVWAADRCSTFGWEARDYEARARRQLAATQSYSVAREFQLGTIRDAQGLENVALVDGTVLESGGSLAIDDAFAVLEGAMGDRFKGRRCMIHLSPQLMTYAKEFRLIEQAGQKWVTALGTIVVADAGYTSEPTGDGGALQLWAYGTSLVTVRLSSIMLVPGSLEEARAQATDRATNTTTIVTERLALVQVDYGNIAGGPPPVAGSAADAVFKVATSYAAWNAS